MTGRYSSGLSEASDNFLLVRFLNSIDASNTMAEEPSSRRSSLKSNSIPATPERQPTVTFDLPHPPRSPLSAKSSHSVTSTITYKSPNYTTELEIRGVFESEEPPLGLDTLIKKLQTKRRALHVLDANTISTFKQCLLVPGNEATIQAVLVPALINLPAIICDAETHAVVEGQFGAECTLPFLLQADEANKIRPPCPDLTVGLRRARLRDHTVILHKFGALAAPIICAPDIVFPCFTLEVKGGSGASDALVQNRRNTATTLYHLRLLSCQARGEQETCKSFDCTIRALSATVSRYAVTISAHWTSEETNGLRFYSYLVKSFGFEEITNEKWDEISRWLQNAIDFIVKQTNDQVNSDLNLIKHAALLTSTSPTAIDGASSSRKRRRR